jgi:HAE1 family hydrophobic/amphiphilic exporter-1
LGRAVIGGTITSTLLTLLVIPTAYEILDEWKEGLFGWIKRRRGVRRREEEEEGPGLAPGVVPEAE